MIIFDMMVVKDVMYISLDTWQNMVESVVLMPSGSAYYATMNGGNVPINQNDPMLSWQIKNPNNATGQVLAI